ncbi:MAG: S8 family peptidase [Verrucomicrobiales bacterium]
MPEGDQSRTPIQIENASARLPYQWNDGGGDSSDKHETFQGSRKAHGERLLGQLRQAETEAVETQFTALGEDYLAERGFLLTFTINPHFKRQLETLDSITRGVELLNVRMVETGEDTYRSEATVFVEHGSLQYFVGRLEKYIQKETNKDFVDPIEQIGLASLASLWTTDKPLPKSGKAIWWEVWIRRGKSEETRQTNVSAVRSECEKNGFALQRPSLKLPEHTVLLLQADKDALARSFGILNCLAEIREPVRATLASGATHGTPDLAASEIPPPSPPPADAPSVCILDTGMNREHPLLRPLCRKADCQSWDEDWGPADDDGHGTEMGGLAAYGDLRPATDGNPLPPRTHWVESVKLLHFSESHEPKNYGAVTQECMARIEQKQKDRSNRVFSMAVTAEDAPDFPDLAPDGLPTSWSAAIDEATVSYLDEDQPRRLFVVSGGNVLDPTSYPKDNHDAAFQDPAQSWNALSVGANTHYTDPREECVAPAGGLSPYSRTTRKWVEFGASDCPLKPEIVFEGGNDYTDRTQSSDPLLPLSLHHEFLSKGQFAVTGATSAATAAVARMAARIHAESPELWPETVRALLVNSARWTPAMLEGVNLRKKGDVTNLVRTVGFGEPSLERAVSCSRSRATFFFQEEIQPFGKVEDGSDIETREMVLLPLPVPKSVLEEMGTSKVRLVVTLSYFIEPNPGRRGLAKSKFRYANCGLRFDLKTSTESIDTFVANRSKKIHDKLGRRRKGDRGNASKGWIVGSNNQDRGSLHHDIWEGKAIDLASRDALVVYPVNGWWKLRKQLGRWDSRQRFALAMTIEADGAEHDLYTAVEQEIPSLAIPQRVREIAAMFETEVEVSA